MERTDRIEEEIKKVVSKLIDQGLKDPRLTGLISVTKVNVTNDLKYAKVYVSILNSKNIKDTLILYNMNTIDEDIGILTLK